MSDRLYAAGFLEYLAGYRDLRNDPWDAMRADVDASLYPRAFKLRNDLLRFAYALDRLRQVGCNIVPAMHVGEDVLPSDPAGYWLNTDQGPVATALRQRWALALQGNDTPPGWDPDSDTTMPAQEAAVVFANGLGAALAMASSATSASILFKVKSTGSGYRLHSTEQYWYSPVVFGARTTTPVDASLAPAHYRFGGDTGGAILWDSGIHPVSATNNSTTLSRF